MVHVNFMGQLSNNIIQYCFGRILATEMNYRLYSSSLPYFTNCINITGNDVGNLINITNDNFNYNTINILHLKNKHGILLNGFFQRSEYYIDYKDQIKEWLYLPESKNNFNITSEDIVLHLRRTDYFSEKSVLHMNYYKNILDDIRFNRVFVCGDSFDADVKEQLNKYNPIYFHESQIEDFKFIKSFNRIIMANSTYSWLASFLSDAQEIYYPIPKRDNSYFGKNSGQDLYCSNFIKISNIDTY